MKIKSKQLYLTITLTMLCLSLVFANSGAAGMGMEHGSGHGMTMHHQHAMLNHALSMALEGANMIMLGQMGMAPGVDEVSVKHGEMMMKDGKVPHGSNNVRRRHEKDAC